MGTQTWTVDAIAGDVFRAWREHSFVEAPSRTARGFDLAAAREVARCAHELRIGAGEQFAGYKVGFTNAVVREQFAAEGLLAAPVYRETLVEPPYVNVLGLLGPRIEPEIVLGVGEDGVAWAALGFEIVQSHVADWNFGWLDAIADFGLHAALAIGERRPFAPEDGERLSRMRVRLMRNGDVVERGAGSDVDGGPLGSLAWLRAELARDGRTALRTGDVVSTGSMTRVPAIVAGERWRIEADDGELSALTIDIVE